MNTELENFLRRNEACSDMITRLAALGAETLTDAWDKASPADLVWIVTRPGVMDAEQRRKFLVMVLEAIEDKLIDQRSKNILTKLRTKEPITDKDAAAARAVWVASWVSAAEAAAEAAQAARAAEAAVQAAVQAAVRRKQARWIHDNFSIASLHTN